MADVNKSISQLDQLDAVVGDDLMIVSHPIGSSYVSRSISVSSLSSILALREDLSAVEEVLHSINTGE